MTAEKFPTPQVTAGPGMPSFPQPVHQASQYSNTPVTIPSPAYFGPNQVEGNNAFFPEPSPHPQMSFPQGHSPNEGFHGQTFTSQTYTQTEMKVNLPCCCPCACCAGCCAAFCCIPCCVCC